MPTKMSLQIGSDDTRVTHARQSSDTGLLTEAFRVRVDLKVEWKLQAAFESLSSLSLQQHWPRVIYSPPAGSNKSWGCSSCAVPESPPHGGGEKDACVLCLSCYL